MIRKRGVEGGEKMGEVKSEHLFIFPFSWKYSRGTYNPLFNQHEQIKGKRFNKLGHWKEHLSLIESPEDYNEYVYFYKPIRSALYTFADRPVVVRNYTYDDLESSGYMRLTVGKVSYELEIRQLELKLFKTGIGLLCFQFLNKKYEEEEAIRAINAFSECVYPPVMPIEKARERGFPSLIYLSLNDKQEIYEDFTNIQYDNRIMISPLIMAVLGKPFVSSVKPNLEECIVIEPILGHQMFCCSMVYNEQLIAMGKEGCGGQIEKWMIMHHEETVNENGEAVRSKPYILMSDDHYYGMNRKVLLGITKHYPCDKLYDQLVKLVLMQRATLLNLSTEIARVATLPKSEISAAISSIYEIYIQFINQLYFKEVTADSEGSLLYEELSKLFKIAEEIEQLNFEMDEVHEYALLVEQSASNLKVQLLTIIGAALVLPSFVTGFFGMNIFKDEAVHWWRHSAVALWLNSYVAFPILVVVALCMWTKRKTTLSLLLKVILSVLLLTSLSFTIKYGCGL